jgi:excisionase family DNA binding protein
MGELLTAKQVQDALKVDRTTIYRMLKDGRLSGVKVGSRWRFPAHEVAGLLSGSQNGPVEEITVTDRALPWQYVESILEVFAEMAGIGSVITDSRGIPVTRMCNSCEFCNLILSSEKGEKACLRSWRQLAGQYGDSPAFTACHAGLQYASAPITVCGENAALLVAGQFYSRQPNPAEAGPRIEALAQQYNLDPSRMKIAAWNVRVLEPRLVHQISQWLSRVANAFAQFGMERVEMLSRLHQIARMSNLDLPDLEETG